MTKSACPRDCEKERHLAVLGDFWIQNDKIIKIENWILNNFDLTSQPNFNVQLCGQTPATRKQCKPEKKNKKKKNKKKKKQKNKAYMYG